MPLGTLDRTPPPFFRQGQSALTKAAVCAALSLFLIVADTRFHVTEPLRAALATLLWPVQRAALWPLMAWESAQERWQTLESARAAEIAARTQLALQAERALRVEQLTQENTRLRALLELRPALNARAQVAQVLYDAADLYSRKVIIDRGGAAGVVLASPVVNERGVVGQVTRVFPQSSEVTLLTDRDAAIPVLNARTQARGAAQGDSSGLELRFMAANADVQVGDALSTSGLDGVYPPGLAVATVVQVERKMESGFARVRLAPVAQPDGARHVLVIEPIGRQLPPRPARAEEPASAPRKGIKR